jgi:mannose/cellobiose epimerase-like protein (N-acyl-D-glucosamine 2-epimerase family)
MSTTHTLWTAELALKTLKAAYARGPNDHLAAAFGSLFDTALRQQGNPPNFATAVFLGYDDEGRPVDDALLVWPGKPLDRFADLLNATGGRPLEEWVFSTNADDSVSNEQSAVPNRAGNGAVLALLLQI